jgi:hypothetical protein
VADYVTPQGGTPVNDGNANYLYKQVPRKNPDGSWILHQFSSADTGRLPSKVNSMATMDQKQRIRQTK